MVWVSVSIRHVSADPCLGPQQGKWLEVQCLPRPWLRPKCTRLERMSRTLFVCPGRLLLRRGPHPRRRRRGRARCRLRRLWCDMRRRPFRRPRRLCGSGGFRGCRRRWVRRPRRSLETRPSKRLMIPNWSFIVFKICPSSLFQRPT